MGRLLFIWIIFSSVSLSAQTFYAKDFGVKGDGAADDGPAIQKAIAAIAAAHGKRTLVFDPGKKYYIKKISGTYLFNFKGSSDITIDGGNSVFLLAGNVRFMSLGSSENMTIKNLSVDYRPLPFADGLVIAKNRRGGYVDVKVNNEFEMPPLGGPTHNPNEQAYFAMLWNKGPHSLLGTHYWVKDVSEPYPGSSAKRIVRVAAGSTFTDWKVIQPNVTKISIPVRGVAHIGPNEVVRIIGSENIYFNNVNIWSAPWFAIGVTRNKGDVEFKNVNICPRPGTGRLTSSWRDGFHVSSNYAKLLWENCLIKGTNDDAFNISSFASSVLKVNSNESMTIKQNYPLNIVPYNVGDIVKVYDVFHGKFLGIARVKSSRGFAQTGEPSAPEITLALDSPIDDMHVGCQVWNESSANPHATLRHCDIYNSCRFQSSIIIDSCDIKALSWFYGDNTEGPIPSNILIKNSNLLLGRGNLTSVVVFSGNMTKNGVLVPPKEPVISNVILQNNVIDGALKMEYADNVCLLNNKFLLPGSKIFLGDCRHVFLRDNTLGGAKIDTLSQLNFMDDSTAASTVIWPDSPDENLTPAGSISPRKTDSNGGNIKISTQKNSGIFYSTLFAKQKTLTRIQNFGDGAGYCFFKDVNGDGKDDAISVYVHGEKEGNVYVALSDGKEFTKPVHALTCRFQWEFAHPLMGDLNGDGKADIVYVDTVTGALYTAFSNGLSFQKPVPWKLPESDGPVSESFLADVNGDGKDDFVYYASRGKNAGKWFVSISKGRSLGMPSSLAVSFGADATQRLVGDVNGDGKADLIAYYDQTGTWKVALSDGKKCSGSKVWAENPANLTRGKSSSEPVCMVYDIDKDGKDDMIVWDKNGDCNWSVAYSSGKCFTGDHVWISNFLKSSHKNNVASPQFGMMGTIDGEHTIAMIVSRGKWLGLGNEDKIKPANPVLINTWEAWGNDYIPDGGTYDAGDPQVNDRQIRQIYDAGFTYIMLDITNGRNDWVDNRAKEFMQRVLLFDRHLGKEGHKIYVNISLGHTRGIIGEDDFFRELNRECERAWKEFYLPFKSIFYTLHGKPMIVHMITTGWKYISHLAAWKGDKTYINKFSNRWMDGTQSGAGGTKSNCYGWIVPGKFGNLIDDEMMPVMPGFWNGITFFKRNNGEMYRSQWMRVIKNKPRSVWVNSFNETWEHTSVEPSYHVIDQFVANPLFTKPWTDYYGNRMDDFYWVMTKQYNQLFMNNVLYAGSYFQEYGNNTIYKVTAQGFVKQTAFPVMAPVLLLPHGFRKHFKGKIMKE